MGSAMPRIEAPMHDTALPNLLHHCHALPLHMLQSRQPMDVDRWNETWADTLAGLHEFSSHGYYGLDVQDLDSTSQLRAREDWHKAALQAMHLPSLAYSRGLPISNLEVLFEHVLHWCNEYAAFVRKLHESGVDTAPSLNTDTNDYPAAVLLLALPVLLERQELIPGAVERLLHNHCDRLLDYLSAAACDKSEASAQFFCPEPYAELTAFFEQQDMRAAPLQKYLQTAYATPSNLINAALMTMGWSDPSASPSHERHWAWEVAALVVLYDLDDSAFARYPRYPADMVAFARQRLSQHYPKSLRA